MSQEQPDNTNFEQRTRELLDASSARLDGRTLSRLTRARHAALGQLQRPARRGWWTLVPVGAAAAALAIVMWTGQPEAPGRQPATAQGVSPLEDLEFLADADAPEFLADGEELEFYEWAAGEMET